ncbi:DUF4041 domain-containing protein [Shewanella frigidimarina]|uniref:DUF4041 domain-containing protein n=1 Tax=Shewanella frigidimarina TaxID=56812 RepID=UPI003D79B866
MFIIILLACLLSYSIYLLLSSRSKFLALKGKSAQIQIMYQPVTIEEQKLNDLNNKYSSLQSSYQDNLTLLRKREELLSKYYISIGTSDSTVYSKLVNSRELKDIESKLHQSKARLKEMVGKKTACICSIGSDVRVNGKKSEATKLFNREVKLRLRCLDNEFKAASALVAWNNINRLIQRTTDTFNEINVSGTTVKTYLSNEYLKLKTEEFRLSYELNQLNLEIKDIEREEAKILREAEREEGRIIAAAEKAEKERIIMEKLVAEELAKLESSTEEQKALYKLHQQELEILREKERRAISLAQLTRAGYVYVISNEMSFGKGVCKIGMTRRADPNDRVKELGDASVPELFDVHAFVFTEDAPTLEKYLHNSFAEQRVNLVNNRKEFFYVMPADVIEKLERYDKSININYFDVNLNK